MAVRFQLGELLQRRSLSQAELARQSGLTTVTINAIVQNRTRGIELETLNALCTALACSPGDLFAYEPDGRKRSTGGSRRRT